MDSIASFRTICYEDIPEHARIVARHCILDWLGCAVAGSQEPVARIVRAEEEVNCGSCTVIGASNKLNVRPAAFVNGVAGHALDFDDMNPAMGGHPSAAIAPGTLALGEECGATGQEFITAFVAGVEVACRLGRYAGAEHYRLGWHSTGTFGTVGAAAAAAHLLKLDETKWRHAIALGVTQAAGLQVSFGSMAKPIHAGKAAADGYLAARLASRGVEGAGDAIDGPNGLVSAAAGGKADSESLHSTRERFFIADTLFKYHAACFGTQSACNAALALRDAIDPDTVDHLDLRVHPSLLSVCGIAEPATGLELKFSLTGVVAMALLGIDTSNATSFSDAQATDPHIVALRSRIRLTGDESLSFGTAVLRAGGLKEEYDSTKPVTDLDTQGARLLSKFRAVVSEVLSPDAVDALVNEVTRVDQLTSLHSLTSAAGGGASSIAAPGRS